MNNVGAFAPTLFESFGFAKTSPFQSQVFTGVFSNVGFGFAKTNNQVVLSRRHYSRVSPSAKRRSPLNSAKRCSRILPAAIYRRWIV